jgi:5-amino-6-(5-phosphoribosylamino)uracil reductase
MSVDGYIDDCRPQRLILSNHADLDAVDSLRANCDAILVGANTIRVDDPRLVIRSEARRQERRSRGLAADPIKVTLTESGRLDSNRSFFQLGEGKKIVYCGRVIESSLRAGLGNLATVLAVDMPAQPESILHGLFDRGVRRLLIEGGRTVNSLFLSAGLVDEMRMAIAPFFVGDESAPRFMRTGRVPYTSARHMTIKSVERLGDMAVIWYLLESTVDMP